MTDPEVRVSFGVKELFGQIKTKLDLIDSKLDSKADLREFVDLKNKVDEFIKGWDQRAAIEANLSQRGAATFSRREKFIGIGLAAVAVLMQPILTYFNHF